MSELKIKRGLVRNGNSLCVIIPQTFLEGMGLASGDYIYLTFSGDHLKIEKVDNGHPSVA